MNANHDAALAAYLRANKIVDADKIASAQTHQAAVMQTASLGQVLLHLKHISQDTLAAAVRSVDNNLQKAASKALPGAGDALSRAVTDAQQTSKELAAVAKLISEELKRK